MFIITPDQTVIELNETGFYPDAFTNESVDLSWSAPTHAVADGFERAIGIFKNNNTLTLSGVVAGQSINKLGNDIFAGEEDRTVAAAALIEAMGDARDCITIDTGSGQIYTDMVLLNAPVRFEVGGVVSFDMTFQQLRTFGVSETFDASLGQQANIGEVSTVEGLPDDITFTAIDDFTAISELCEAECGTNNPTCLNNCFETRLEG